ncbi:MAG: sensor histidine kinase [Chloroflexi bacterium]|nr:sensor histidine kinase [Chloroflexota bacterium]
MNAHEQADRDNQLAVDEANRRGQLVLNTLPIVGIPVVVAIIMFIVLRIALGESMQPLPDQRPLPFSPFIPIIVVTVFFSSLIILVRLGRPTVSALLLIGAWTLVTTLTALQYGVTSIFPALLIMPICAAGLLIDAVASVSLALLATLFVGVLAWLEAQGLRVGSPDMPPIFAQNPSLVSTAFWIVIFWSVAALTSQLAGGLQRALNHSRKQAHALSELSAQLEERVRSQTAKLLAQEREAAVLEERQRVARDIHDTLAQGLTGVVVQLGAAERALDVEPSEAQPHVVLARRLARESLAEARRSIWNLRNPALQRGELGDALRGLAERASRPGLSVRYAQQGEVWPLLPDAESALLRIAQEALVNVSKHAGATHVEVNLAYAGRQVQLAIIDNGKGFDPRALSDRPSGPESGFGLLGMRERLAALGGTLQLGSDGGAQVLATVPHPDPVRGSAQPGALDTESGVDA